MEGETDNCDAEWLQLCQSTTHTDEEIAQATKIAWLVAGLSGAIDPKQLTQQRATRAQPLELSA